MLDMSEGFHLEIIESWNSRVVCVGISSSSSHGQGQFLLSQVAPNPIQPGFGHLQGWGSLSYSEQEEVRTAGAHQLESLAHPSIRAVVWAAWYAGKPCRHFSGTYLVSCLQSTLQLWGWHFFTKLLILGVYIWGLPIFETFFSLFFEIRWISVRVKLALCFSWKTPIGHWPWNEHSGS